MSVQPGHGNTAAMALPDFEAGVIDRIKTKLAADYPTLRVTDRFPLDPITQVPLVVARPLPGATQDERFIISILVAVDVWHTTRGESRALADAVRRALLTLPWSIDARGSVSTATANPLPHRIDTGDEINATPRYAAAYNLLVRLR